MRLRIFPLAAIALVGCGAALVVPPGAGRHSARAHLEAAAREHRLADEEFARIRPGDIGAAALEAEGPAFFRGTPDFGPSSDPTEPEYYGRDPRVRDPNERYEDAAHRHRRRAEQHEAAARGDESPSRH